MYESPIEKIYGDIQSQIIKQDEEHTMYAVNQAISYTVDKEELIKALQYDREQYEKGHKDAKTEILAKVKQAINEICKISPVATTIGNTIPVMKNCDDIKLEVVAILNKLIAESEEVNVQ